MLAAIASNFSHIHPGDSAADAREDRLRHLSRELEAGFLAHMLEAAGLNATAATFGGGAGEDHFASFLRREHARLMVEAGGIGLAEQIFRSLAARDHIASEGGAT